MATFKKDDLVHINEKHLVGEYSYMLTKPCSIYEIIGDQAMFLTASKPMYVPLNDITLHVGEWLNLSTNGIVIVDSRLSNGKKVYLAAYDYFNAINEYTDAGRILISYSKDNFKLKGKVTRTVTRDMLMNISGKL